MGFLPVVSFVPSLFGIEFGSIKVGAPNICDDIVADGADCVRCNDVCNAGTVDFVSFFCTDLLSFSLFVLLIIVTGADIIFGGSTTVTRNRDDDDELLVGEQLFDDGGVIGEETLLLSTTRDTWKRLRDGLGIGEEAGDGIGDGEGDRKRPLRAGSNRRSPLTCCGESFALFRILWHVSEIFREFKKLARTRFTVRIGSGSGGFSFLAHNERILFTTRL